MGFTEGFLDDVLGGAGVRIIQGEGIESLARVLRGLGAEARHGLYYVARDGKSYWLTGGEDGGQDLSKGTPYVPRPERDVLISLLIYTADVLEDVTAREDSGQIVNPAERRDLEGLRLAVGPNTVEHLSDCSSCRSNFINEGYNLTGLKINDPQGSNTPDPEPRLYSMAEVFADAKPQNPSAEDVADAPVTMGEAFARMTLDEDAKPQNPDE